jgi:hypothetical protein
VPAALDNIIRTTKWPVPPLLLISNALQLEYFPRKQIVNIACIAQASSSKQAALMRSVNLYAVVSLAVFSS